MEHEEEQAREQADQLEAQADELEEKKDDFGEQVDDLRQDWEQKQQAEDVPGAQEEGAHDTGEPPPDEAQATPGD